MYDEFLNEENKAMFRRWFNEGFDQGLKEADDRCFAGGKSFEQVWDKYTSAVVKREATPNPSIPPHVKPPGEQS